MEIDFSLVLTRLQTMVNGFFQSLPNILVGLLIFLIFYYLAKGINALVRRLSSTYGYPENLGLVLGRLSRTLAIVLGLLVALLTIFPDFSAGQLIQLLGVGGIGASIAFRDIFGDFFAGILLLIMEPFRVGDQIILDDFEGTIEEIQTRATFVRTYDSRRVVIPNTHLFTNSVTVNTAYESRRVEYDLGIGYGDDIKTAVRVILEAIDTVPGILKTPAPEVLVRELADFNVTLRVRWWISPPRRYDAVDTRDKILAAIKDRLAEHGIDLPFPTQQILFHDQTEETDGDRTRQREGWPAGPGAVPKPYRS
jgi:small-conductance mechanosensitive channel